MEEEKDMVTVQVNLDITVESLKTVVANAKAVAGKDDRGVYRVDTADKLGEIISQFLMTADFQRFAADLKNYN
ncbi:hypothetical protein HRM2_16750 [Desulforapulum autotrophicum HRM2]|jgi:hypothetical protein|uniref:Uncharacterized protein n=1 Tax=Desulforapulum autotrophicum (strain ATCC 43914 / DSM 3382 / VKM B-1955 / HRM2) TaxID=177437 RepID=C0QAY4_DESAH|nr:hypothetical protein [Desulforapulum autotrophicum]ACN14783.1 hypothetical protein HRM2_16750 [Desulforapulum autotrophicum HRM2]